MATFCGSDRVSARLLSSHSTCIGFLLRKLRRLRISANAFGSCSGCIQNCIQYPGAVAAHGHRATFTVHRFDEKMSMLGVRRGSCPGAGATVLAYPVVLNRRLNPRSSASHRASATSTASSLLSALTAATANPQGPLARPPSAIVVECVRMMDSSILNAFQ